LIRLQADAKSRVDQQVTDERIKVPFPGSIASELGYFSGQRGSGSTCAWLWHSDASLWFDCYWRNLNNK
jgi:hypothetical protein